MTGHSYKFFIFFPITIIVWVRNWTLSLSSERTILYESTFYYYYGNDEEIFTLGVSKVSQKEKNKGGKCCVTILRKKSHLFGQVNGINSDCGDSTVDLYWPWTLQSRKQDNPSMDLTPVPEQQAHCDPAIG